MNTEPTVKRVSHARPIFCLALVLALIAGLFTLSSVSAKPSAADYDVEIAGCSTHTAAISEGDLYLWGVNDDGQFPGSPMAYSPEPVKLMSGVKAVAVTPGRTLVVDQAGVLTAYGTDPIAEKPYDASGTKIAEGVAKVAAFGTNYAYITEEGALYTAGLNDMGQLGVSSANASGGPVMALDSGAVKAALGRDFILALKDDGSLYGWGGNSYLQLGYREADGSIPASVPAPVKIMDGVKDMSAGKIHTCILTETGDLWTCGSNQYSQAGTQSEDPSYSPLTRILGNVTAVSAGSFSNFAMTASGSIYSWGYGTTGQLGNDDMILAAIPTETPLEYVKIFSGGNTCFGLTADGYIYSWGSNTGYLLAKDDSSDSPYPVRVLDTKMNWLYAAEEEEAPGEETETPDDGAAGTGEESAGTGEEAGGETGGEGGEGSETPAEPTVNVVPFISGKGEGIFDPDTEVTRAEFLKMVAIALCDYSDAKDYGTSSFSDIPLNRWFENYIAYAERQQLVSGYKDGTFRPDGYITRQEAVKIAAVALKLDLEKAADAGFADVTGWAVPYVNAFAATGALQGKLDGLFHPEDYITRAEAAKVVAVAAGFDPKKVTDETLAAVKNPFTDVSEAKWYYVYILRAAGLVE